MIKYSFLRAKIKIIDTFRKTDYCDFLNMITGWVLLVWGFWLILPLNTFDTSVIYQMLQDVLPINTSSHVKEYIWGITFFLVGFYQSFTFLFNSMKSQRKSIYVSFSLWAFISCLSIWCIPRVASASFIFHVTFTICLAWVYIRMGERLRK